MAAKNLWGDLSDLESIRTPKAILQEQAKYLTDATDGILVGNVEDRVTGGAFMYDLDVIVPTLNNYAYTVLTINHPLALYPVRLNASKPATSVSCENEDELETAVSEVLTSAEIKAVLANLLAQAS